MSPKVSSLANSTRLAAIIFTTIVIAAHIVRPQPSDNVTMVDVRSGVINGNDTGSNGNNGNNSGNNNSYGGSNNYGNNSSNYGNNSDNNNNNYGSNGNNQYGNSKNDNYLFGSGNRGSNGYGSGDTDNNNYGSSNKDDYGSSNSNTYGSSGGNNYGNSNINHKYENSDNNNNYGSSDGDYGTRNSNNGNHGTSNSGYENSGGNSHGSSNDNGNSNSYGSSNSGNNNYRSNGRNSDYGNIADSNGGSNNNNYGARINNRGTGEPLVYGSRYNSTGNHNNNNNGRCIARGNSTIFGAQIFYFKLRSSNLAQWNPRGNALAAASSNFAFRPITTNATAPNDFFDNAMFLARGNRGVTAVSMPFAKWYLPTFGPYSDYEAIIDYSGGIALAPSDTEEALTVRSHFSVTTFNTQFYPYPPGLVSDRDADPRLASAGIYLSSGRNDAATAGLLYGIVATNHAIWGVYARDAVVKANLTAPWMAFRSYRRLQNRTSSRELIDAAIQYDSGNGEVNYYLNCNKVWTLEKFGLRPNATDGAVITSVVAGAEADVPLSSLTAWSFSISVEKPLDNVDPNAGNAMINTQGLVRTDTSQTYILPTSFWDPLDIRTNVLYGEGLTAFFYDVSFALLNVTLDDIDR